MVDEAKTQKPRTVVLIGGSGFLGRGLRERLVARGDRVSTIGRGPDAVHEDWRHVHWDATSLGGWTAALEGADVIVHLAGKRVDCRPTRSNIDELIRSRESTVRLVGDAVGGLIDPPTAWVQLSSLAIFGDGGDEIIDENTTPPTHGPRQMVEVCRRWEAAYHRAVDGLERTVLLRPAIGIGGAGDPATARLVQLAKMGLAGPVAGGRQWVSWIGAVDFFDLLLRAVDDDSMSGLYHLASPNPVTNAEMMAGYRRAVGRRFGLPSPRWLTTLGAWTLGSDPQLALTGRRCIPRRLLGEGYRFRQPDFDEAVEAAVARLERTG